jgi:hypothetical protein
MRPLTYTANDYEGICKFNKRSRILNKKCIVNALLNKAKQFLKYLKKNYEN